MPVLDTLPALGGAHALTDAERDAFSRDGHVVLRGVATSDEVGAYRSAIRDGVARYNTETRPIEERDTYGKAFLQVPNLWRHDQAVARFVLAPRFASLAAQ